jgi:hypothetical protein
MKPLRLILGIFLSVGVLMLAGGVFWVQHTRQFLARAATAPGVVIQNVWGSSNSSSSGTAHPKVRFRTQTGQEFVFVSSVGSSPPSYRTNEAVTVLYDPDDPDHASISSFVSLWLGAAIFLGLGVIFSSIGFIPMLVQRRTRARDEWLRAGGQHIQANFERVELNTSIRVNNSCPYRIVCQWLNPATNQVHVFKSHNIWFDPTEYISGKTMEVIVDPNNYKRYVVETSFLPKLAE